MLLSLIIIGVSLLLLLGAWLFLRHMRQRLHARDKTHFDELSDTPSTWLSHRGFEQRLLDRTPGGRFTARECCMLRFRTQATGVSEALVELLIQRLDSWSIPHDFFATKVKEEGFVILVEDVALPEQVLAIEDQLRSYLDLPWGHEQHGEPEFVLESASFPYDVDQIGNLWSAVETRLAARQHRVNDDSIKSPRLSLLDNGVLVLNHGEGAGMSYAGFLEAFQLYQDEFESEYPGLKLPYLSISSGKITDADARAAQFMRSDAVVNMTAAVAVVPNNNIERHIMKMFSYYHQPPYPFQIFDAEEEAIAWLAGYVSPLYWEIKKSNTLTK